MGTAWEANAPGGETLTLMRQDREFVILANGRPSCRAVCTGRKRRSQRSVARVRRADEPRVLVGGLGMGYTLAATLGQLPLEARVVVAELVPGVVEWNRGALGECAGRP